MFLAPTRATRILTNFCEYNVNFYVDFALTVTDHVLGGLSKGVTILRLCWAY